MHWLEKIYSDLNKEFKNDLENFDMTAEEIIKDVFLRARNRLVKGEDLLIHFLGTFKIRPDRLYYEAHELWDKILEEKSKESPNTEKIKIKEEKLKVFVDLYNSKKDKKHGNRAFGYRKLLLTENGLESDGPKNAKGLSYMVRKRRGRTTK